jgi:hypothetical protein
VKEGALLDDFLSRHSGQVERVIFARSVHGHLGQ